MPGVRPEGPTGSAINCSWNASLGEQKTERFRLEFVCLSYVISHCKQTSSVIKWPSFVRPSSANSQKQPQPPLIKSTRFKIPTARRVMWYFSLTLKVNECCTLSSIENTITPANSCKLPHSSARLMPSFCSFLYFPNAFISYVLALFGSIQPPF